MSDAVGWLDTIGDSVAATLRAAPPDRTILPPPLDSSDARALAVLAQLAGRAPGSSIQLVQGEVLGEGGMGIVRLAEQVALGRTVAVKGLKQPDPAAALDLLREAWLTGAIEHPNVVPVHYVELDRDGSPLVVLKRIEGAPWSRLAGDAAEVARRFGATDLLAWNLGVLMQVLNAIRYAHHRGVIHRDLKPSNVMIGDFGEVYLLDWGIAVSLRDDGTGRLPLASAATQLAGTPSYMAPEMLGRPGSPPLSERTDVYLAGAVLYELVAGHAPHAGDDVLAVIASIVKTQPVLPATAPAELARICTRAMHVDPAQRFESVEAMRLALQAYLEHRGSTELGERAGLRLDELLALLATPGATRDDLYRAFGACRFGFHEALAVWRDNTDATAGLRRATIAVAEHELAAGNHAAAVSLLADIDAPELAARAREAAAAGAKKLAALEALRAEHDPTVGRRTRTFFAVLFGTMFTALPLIGTLHDQIASQRGHIGFAFGFLVVVALVGWWARRTIMATAFNRRLFATLAFNFTIQGVLAIGQTMLGTSVPSTEISFVIVWAALTGMLAIMLDAWLAIAAIGYVIAFLLAARFPDQRAYFMSASNLLLALNAIWRWRPATFRPTPEERARM